MQGRGCHWPLISCVVIQSDWYTFVKVGVHKPYRGSKTHHSAVGEIVTSTSRQQLDLQLLGTPLALS